MANGLVLRCVVSRRKPEPRWLLPVAIVASWVIFWLCIAIAA